MTWSNTGKTATPRRAIRGLVAMGVIAAALAAAEPAAAQVGTETVDSGVKGTIGGILVGAEAVLLVEAAFDVQPWWGYALGGGLGAIGGGVGGYFVDQQNEAAVSMSFLVAGLVLAVPTTIAVLNATAYEPETNPVIDEGNDAVASRPLGPVMAVRPITPSLASFSDEAWSLRFPAVEVSTHQEKTVSRLLATGPRLTAPTDTTVLIPVLGMSF